MPKDQCLPRLMLLQTFHELAVAKYFKKWKVEIQTEIKNKLYTHLPHLNLCGKQII